MTDKNKKKSNTTQSHMLTETPKVTNTRSTYCLIVMYSCGVIVMIKRLICRCCWVVVRAYQIDRFKEPPSNGPDTCATCSGRTRLKTSVRRPPTSSSTTTSADAPSITRTNKLSPRGRRDDMPSPMAVRLAADQRPSQSAMATLQAASVPIT